MRHGRPLLHVSLSRNHKFARRITLAHLLAPVYIDVMDTENDITQANSAWRNRTKTELLRLFRILDRRITRQELVAAGQFPLGRFLIYSTLLCGALNGCVFLYFLPHVPAQVRAMLTLTIMLAILLAHAAVFVGFPSSIVLAFLSGLRGLGLRLALLGILYLSTLYVALSAGPPTRMASFRTLAERSMPLVEAVHAYVQTEGHPPDSLEVLIPKYLDSVPTTGLAGYPHYEMYKGEDSPLWQDNPWVLCVRAGRMMNWDLFLYFPKQNYPLDENSAFERMGAWAYYHE